MALRVFEDREGQQWRVWSVVPAASAAATLDAEFRAGWLCFERIDGGGRCRLTMTETPAAWESLPDDRLDLLRRVATPVPTPLESGPSDTNTGKRPIENAARDRPSGPKSVIGEGDERDALL
jgi:hypothetical protein